MPKILIVEDEALVALDLRMLIESTAPSHEVWTEASVAKAVTRLGKGIDFAFLDINVIGGTTIELGRLLKSNGVSFVFMSAAHSGAIPDDLKSVTLLAKPCSLQLLLKALNHGLYGT